MELQTETDSKGYEIVYYALIVVDLIIISAFSYMTYLFYQTTKGTYAFKFTIVMPLPIIIALVLLVLLVSAGKQSVSEELRAFLKKS